MLWDCCNVVEGREARRDVDLDLNDSAVQPDDGAGIGLGQQASLLPSSGLMIGLPDCSVKEAMSVPKVRNATIH